MKVRGHLQSKGGGVSVQKLEHIVGALLYNIAAQAVRTLRPLEIQLLQNAWQLLFLVALLFRPRLLPGHRFVLFERSTWPLRRQAGSITVAAQRCRAAALATVLDGRRRASRIYMGQSRRRIGGAALLAQLGALEVRQPLGQLLLKEVLQVFGIGVRFCVLLAENSVVSRDRNHSRGICNPHLIEEVCIGEDQAHVGHEASNVLVVVGTGGIQAGANHIQRHGAAVNGIGLIRLIS